MQGAAVAGEGVAAGRQAVVEVEVEVEVEVVAEPGRVGVSRSLTRRSPGVNGRG
ncbi:hypothetical protein ACFRFL_44970 [Streptomyces sp. NPDC056708]|uniref:hypothetical protein n=1 Tax=unclassified Streptomyces TaxID=2593676 RepID=UPI0036A34079